MSQRKARILVSALTVVLSGSFNAFADGGAVTSYSPYSLFALGDMNFPGTAYNRTMGGVGIASRNNKFINIINPAAVTARDSLSFMVDFSVNIENRLFGDGTNRSANNNVNIGDCVISFPIWHHSAMMIGIQPYSGTGYDFAFYETDKKALATLGSIKSTYNGTGGIYQAFIGAGVTFFKRLSLGAEFLYYFGNVQRTYSLEYELASAPDIIEVKNLECSTFSGKFGLQYEQPIGNEFKLGLGATYKLRNNLSGYLSSAMSSTYTDLAVDTLKNTPGRLVMPSEIGAGLSINYGDNFRAEFDYTRSDWTSTNFDTDSFFAMQQSSAPFTTSVSEAYRFGVEWIPNRNDIRYYFKKVAYRAGFYHKTDYYCVNGQKVKSNGITLGATFPIFRWHNGLSLALEFGRRGNVSGGLVRETYFNACIGVNLFDIWFQKPKYE